LVVSCGAAHPAARLARHDETNLARAMALAALAEPMALGVLYARPAAADRPGLSRLAPTPPMTRAELAALLAGSGAS
jgi:hypothetical protein